MFISCCVNCFCGSEKSEALTRGLTQFFVGTLFGTLKFQFRVNIHVKNGVWSSGVTYFHVQFLRKNKVRKIIR